MASVLCTRPSTPDGNSVEVYNASVDSLGREKVENVSQDFCVSRLSMAHPIAGKTLMICRSHSFPFASSETRTSKLDGSCPHSSNSAGTKYSGMGRNFPLAEKVALRPAKSPPMQTFSCVIVEDLENRPVFDRRCGPQWLRRTKADDGLPTDAAQSRNKLLGRRRSTNTFLVVVIALILCVDWDERSEYSCRHIPRGSTICDDNSQLLSE